MPNTTAIYAMSYEEWLTLANTKQSGYIEHSLFYCEDSEPDELRLRFNLFSHETIAVQDQV